MSDEGIHLVPVSRESVIHWWESLLPFMASFLERAGDRYLPGDILAKIQKGEWQLWVVMDGHFIQSVCMTCIVKYPRAVDMRIIMMVGEDRALWIHLLAKLEGYAKGLGCAKITGEARPGWEKILKPLGYKKTHVYLEKDL